MEFYSKMAKENKKETDDESFAQQNVGLGLGCDFPSGLWTVIFCSTRKKKTQVCQKSGPFFWYFQIYGASPTNI